MLQWFKKTLLFFLFFITQVAFCWDSTGHRIISAIAYADLTPKAKQKIDSLTLLLDPAYPPLARFLYVSTLPDKWRQNDKQKLSGWHFIDRPWSVDGTPTHPPQTPTLVDMMQENRAILTSTTHSDTEKARALAYVIHLTQDAHQPLHGINRFSREFPQGDRGGNLFPIQAKFADNLHAYWDQSARQIGQNRKHYPFNNKEVLQLAAAIQADYPKDFFKERLNDFSALHWTTESYVIAQQKVYDIVPGSKPSTVYKKMLREIAAQQMALAGYRLASLLNKIS